MKCELTDFDRWMIFGSRRSASEMKYRNMQSREISTQKWDRAFDTQYHCGAFS